MTGARSIFPAAQGDTRAGSASLEFRHVAGRTVLARAFAQSPLRFLTPENHGTAAWVIASSFGGGLVEGDQLRVRLDVGDGAFALVGTQSSTKVYRSLEGSGQRTEARLGEGASLALVPDPVVCFAHARYTQEIGIDMAESASIVVLDGYTCGRRAFGERWAFARYASRSIVRRGGKDLLVDATELDACHGAIASRMREFNVLLTLFAFGPRFGSLVAAIRAHGDGNGLRNAVPSARVMLAASPVGVDGAIVRVAAEHVEHASRSLRGCFDELAHLLGDDPFARKW